MDEGLYGASLIVLVVFGIIYAIVLFLLPFYVFRIRNEIIGLNQTMKRLLVLVEAVIPDAKKPKPPIKPKEVLVDGQLMRVCPKCGTNNDFNNQKCRQCKAVLFNS